MSSVLTRNGACSTPSHTTTTYPDPPEDSMFCELFPEWEPCGVNCERDGYNQGDFVYICNGGVKYIAKSLVGDNEDHPFEGALAEPPTWKVSSMADWVDIIGYDDEGNEIRRGDILQQSGGCRRVDTVADMAALTDLSVGDCVITQGYYEVGDHGDNTYEIVSGGVIDGGEFIKVGALVAQGTFPNGIVNTRQFGLVGDFEANDSAAVQNTINYRLANDGGDVHTPSVVSWIPDTVYVPQDVNIIAETEAKFAQKTGDVGNVLHLLASRGTTTTKESPQTVIENLRIDGNLAGFESTVGSTTAGSNQMTVTDTSGIAIGMAVEANGVATGTTVTAISGNTLTLSANATANTALLQVGFRPAVSVSMSTTTDSVDAVVSPTGALVAGHLVTGAGIAPYTYIKEVNDNGSVVLTRPATATGVVTVLGEVFNIGIFVEDATASPVYVGNRIWRGPRLINTAVTQMSGDGIHVRPRRHQTEMDVVSSTSNRGSGCIMNSCSDTTIAFSGFGSNWRHGLNIATSATPRIVSTECWQTYLNDKYVEFRSQANTQLTYAYGEINGAALVVDNSAQDEHNITLDTVNFKFTSKNLNWSTGVAEAYVFNDGADGVRLHNCYFLHDTRGGAVPDYIVHNTGGGHTELLGGNIPAASYLVDITNAPGFLAYMFPSDDVQSAMRMQRLRLERAGSAGRVQDFLYDGTNVGGISLTANRPIIEGADTGDGVQVGDGVWDGNPLRLHGSGGYIWLDTTVNRPRFSWLTPTSETDGLLLT